MQSVICGRTRRTVDAERTRGTMHKLTIAAASRQSALGFHAALADFQTVLIRRPDERYDVEIFLGRGGDREIIGVLNAIELYVSRRASGPARIDPEGHSYVLHPVPDPVDAQAEEPGVAPKA